MTCLCYFTMEVRIKTILNVDKLTHDNLLARMDIVMMKIMWAKDPRSSHQFSRIILTSTLRLEC